MNTLRGSRDVARSRYFVERTDAAWRAWCAAQDAVNAEDGVNAWGEELPAAPFDFCELMGIIFECACVDWAPRAHHDPLAFAIHQEFSAENRRWVYA